MSAEELTATERRLVTGVVLIAAAYMMVPAAYNYVLDPMLEGLHASESQTSLLRQLPSIAMLGVVFLSGVLGDRFGDRRILLRSALMFTVGSLLVAVAPVFGIAALGLVVQSVAISAGTVVSLGLMSAKISDPAQRASAFSLFAIVGPLVYLVIPIISGGFVDNRTWRLVPALWVLGGLVAWWACLRLLPVDGPARNKGELVTPLLAGIVLASGVQAINSATSNGVTSPDTLIRTGICVVGLLGLMALYRRVESPSLSLAALRSGGMLILLAVVLLVPFANIWYYATMGYQYVFGLTTLQTALAMIPAQMGAVVGAMITRRLLQRLGVRIAGTTLLLAFAASLLGILAIAADSPLWVPILAMVFYAAAFTGASVPITNAIMNTAPPGEEGSASAFRSAAGHIGTAVGVVFTTFILTTTVTSTLIASLESQGLANQDSREIVSGIIDGATSENLSAQYAVPVEEVDSISSDLSVAMVAGLHDVAVAGTVIALACSMTFWVALRRQEHQPA